MGEVIFHWVKDTYFQQIAQEWNDYLNETETETGLVTGTQPVGYIPPLYFQHQGHSRTIVGYDEVGTGHEKLDQSLYIFDPTHTSKQLQPEQAVNLKKMQFQVSKKGVPTASFGRKAYQIVFLRPGFLTESEIEKSKVIHSTLIRV